MYSIVKYAHLINKNTSDFTAGDMSRWMAWEMKQPLTNEENKQMANNGKLKSAMSSRLPMELTTEDIETVVVEQVEAEIVADMGLTQLDVDSLAWALTEILGSTDFSESPETAESLNELAQALEPLVTKGE